jgi:PAS domain S-box-containing protein
MQNFIEMNGDVQTSTDPNDRSVRQSAQLALTALAAAEIGTFAWDVVTQQVTWNERHAVLLGYDPSIIEASYANWESRIHPDDLAEVKIALNRAQTEGNDYISEHRAIWPDGSIHWLYERGKFEYDADNRPIRLVGISYDISVRKHTELALHESQERMGMAIDAARMGTCDWDIRTGQIVWNEYHIRLLDYEPGTIEYNYENWARRVHPADLDRVNAALDLAMTSRTDYAAEYRVVWADGSIKWIYGFGRFYYDRDGNAIRMAGIASDITARKEAELALQASEERLQLAIAGARLGTYDWDLVADRILTSAYFNQLMGFAPDAQITVTDWQQSVHPEDLAMATSNLERSRAEQTDLTQEYRVIWPDGSIHWIAGFGRYYYDREGRAVRLAGGITEITDRKQAELSLAASEERMSLTIEAAQIGTFDWNVRTEEIIWNDYHRLLLGYQRDVPASYAAWETRVHPEDLQRVRTAVQMARATGTDYTCEYRIIWEDGSLHWLEAFGRFYYDRQQQPIRMMGIVNDITDRQQARIALEESEQRFRSLIEATTQIVWTARPDGSSQLEQASWNAFTGQSITASEQWDFLEAIHPDDRARTDAAWESATATLTQYAVEHRLRRADGEYRAMLGRAVPILNTDGSLREWIGVHTDITDRQQAERALADSERRYRALIDATTQIVWSTRADGHVIREQPSWGAFTGQSFAEYCGWGWIEAIHPEDRAHTNDSWIAAVTNVTIFEIEHRLQRHDGEYRYMSVRGVPILAEDGSVSEWVGIHTDITDRKLDEANLRRSEEFNRRILENNKDCIKVIDLEGRLLYMNDGGKKLMEISDFAAVCGNSWVEFWRGADREAAQAAFITARAGEVSKFEGLCPTALGTPKYWQVTVAPMLDHRGQVEQVLSISHDITDRIAAESEIRESENRFRSTFEQAALGVAHASLEGRWLLVNQKFCQIVGYTESELLQLNFQTLTPSEDLPHDLAAIRQLMAGESETIELEKRYIHKLGHLVWVEITASLRRNAIGETSYFIVTIADITARKESELALQAQTLELAKTTALVEQRNQELDRFTHIVSHDLKAPLRGISNLAEWIAEDLDGDVDPEIYKNLELMRSRVYRMEAMINGLLQYARVGNTRHSTTTFALADLLAEILDSLAIPASFTVDLPASLPSFTTHRLLLSQVLTNLIGNAWKHHDRPDGRIQVTVKMRPDVSAAAPAKHRLWEFTISDDGPGIPDRDREQVFGIFQTLTSSNKDSTGIGLSIVKKIVESQGGHIEIVDPLLGGTTFRFTWTEEVANSG